MSILVSLIKQHTPDWRLSPSKEQRSWVARVPLDIIIEIAERLNSPEDILSLSLTVCRVAFHVNRALTGTFMMTVSAHPCHAFACPLRVSGSAVEQDVQKHYRDVSKRPI